MKNIKKVFIKQSYPLTILLLLALLLNCSTANEESDLEEKIPETGKFFGVVGTTPNQGLYEDLDGQATYTLNTDSSLFEINLTSIQLPEDTTSVVFKIRATEIPTVGEYSFNNIDEINQVNESSFSGLYFSQSVGLSEQYYTESGTLTITSLGDSIIGTFKAQIYYKISIQSDGYTRSYNTTQGSFNAIEFVE